MTAKLMNDDPGGSLVGRAVGAYQVLPRLGVGGMGRCIARDTKLNREVALKVLPDAFTRDPDRTRAVEETASVSGAATQFNWRDSGPIWSVVGALPVHNAAAAGEHITVWDRQ